MSHNILITGGSGYLGGTLLANWNSANLPAYNTLYALVRTADQATAVQQYGAVPLTIDLADPNAVKGSIISNNITVVFHLFYPLDTVNTVLFIEALAEVKKRTGVETHFLFTTGAKLFSEHAGAPTDRQISDVDAGLFDVQEAQVQKAPHPLMGEGVRANNLVTTTAAAHRVRSYVFAPCIVYGPGTGFGNKISIQTVAIVKAAKALRRVYKVDKGRPTWPVCHVQDNTGLYLEILRAILEGKGIGYGKQGYYLASPGRVAWDDIYAGLAKGLKKRGVIDDEVVEEADDEILGKMAEALGCPKDFVAVQVGGLCTFTAENGKKIGWKPQYDAKHILEAADAEAELILKHLKD